MNERPQERNLPAGTLRDRLSALLLALGGDPPGPLDRIAERALRLCAPAAIADLGTRERRILVLAFESAELARSTGVLNHRHLCRHYVALLACEWARDPSRRLQERNAAFVAAVALASGDPGRFAEIMGVAEALADLARCAELDLSARLVASELARGQPLNPAAATKGLEHALRRFEPSTVRPQVQGRRA